MSIGTFREWLRESELNEALVKEADLSKIKSDKDAYSDIHNILIDKKNKRLLITDYYGEDKEILKHQEKLNKELKKELKKYKLKLKKVLYMFDDRDNNYRNTLFEIE